MPIQSAKSVAAGSSPVQPLSPIKDDGKGKSKAQFDLAALKGEQRSEGGNRSSERGDGASGKDGRGLDAGRTLDSGRSSEAGRSQETGRTSEGGLRPDSGRSSDSRDISLARFNLPVLREGAKEGPREGAREKPEVGLAQRCLNALGYTGCKADGKFGPKTTEAVRTFQIDQGLKNDGIVGNRETWPAMNKALVTRHEGLTRLGDAMAGHRSMSEPMGAELKQLNTLLVEFNKPAALRARDDVQLQTPTLATRPSGEMVYVSRGSETLADVGRMLGIPFTALLASNPDIEKPYLILAGQQLIIPKLIKDQFFRKQPRQLHPADPDGHLASSNMHQDFVARVNGMIEQLRGEGFDVRVMAGFRTYREQQARFEQGRTESGSVVTDLEAGHSWHNYGLAVDMVLNDDDGDLLIPEEWSPFWQRLGDVAVAHGVIWGGAFGYPEHLEYHPGYGRNEAARFIEDFESYGLEVVWESIELDLSD